MTVVTAMNQAKVADEKRQVQAEFEETTHQMTDLQAQQTKLQRVMTRNNVQTALLGSRSVPAYASWLPFSFNKAG